MTRKASSLGIRAEQNIKIMACVEVQLVISKRTFGPGFVLIQLHSHMRMQLAHKAARRTKASVRTDCDSLMFL